MQYKWTALSCTSLGAFFSVISGGTLVIALPNLMTDLHASFVAVIWLFLSYMLLLTVLVPIIGHLGDKYGKKRLFVGGFFLFTLGSFLCSLAHSASQLILFRLVQAVGGALLVANSTAIVTDAFGEEELGKALGINSMIIGVGSVVAPILGGFLINSGWQSVFLINIPFGLIGMIWAHYKLKDSKVIFVSSQYDWLGTIVFTLGLCSALGSLTLAPFFGLFSLGSGLASVGLFVWFYFIEKRAPHPMMDLRLIKTRILAFSYCSNFLNAIARGSLSFLFVFYFQLVKGLDPIIAGMMLSPFALGLICASPVFGHFADRYDARILSSSGLIISSIGLIGFLYISPDTSYTQLFIWSTIMGIGSGMFFSPNTRAIMSNVPFHKRGIASGIRTMMNNAGMMVSLGMTIPVLSHSLSIKGASIDVDIPEFINGLHFVFFISFGMSLIAAVISFLRGPDWRETSV